MPDDRPHLRTDARPDVPDHLAGWYAGDLAAAARAHAEHAASAPEVPPARRSAEDGSGGAPAERAPAEGGRFLAAWYAGDLAAACRARAEHDVAPDVVRMGRTSG